MLKNVALIVLSLILSCLFWLGFVGSQQNIKTFDQPISVEIFNVPEGLSVSTEVPSVSIKIDANKDIYKELTENDFQAFINLAEAEPGKKTFTIEVNSNNPLVRIVSFTPGSVEMTLEEKKEEKFKIELGFAGEVAEGFTVQQSNQSAWETLAKGGDLALSKISYVKGIIELHGEKSNFKRKVQLYAYDNNGNQIKEVELIPAYIDADVVLSQVTESKAVGIKVPITGELNNAGLYVKGVKISPNLTEIRAKQYVLNTIDTVNTEEVDISDFTATQTLFLKIIPPLEAEITGTKSVKVVIEIEPVEIPGKP